MKHAQHYIQMFSEIMVPLGVVTPLINDGLLLLRSFLTKKNTLEMMEEFVDSEVLEAVRQGIAKVKIERTAKVKELQGEALQRKEEQELTKAEAYYEESRLDEAIHKEEEKMKAEHARQQKKEQEEQARQRKEEQEEQVPKARGKYKTFDERMEDMMRFKETHGHANVSIREDKPLAQFCVQMSHARQNPGKSKRKQLTNEQIAAFDALDFVWTTREYVTRSFDERINDLREYKQKHGHVNVKTHEDSSLSQFCAQVRHSLKQPEKNGTIKLTEERILRLDALDFEWTH